MIAAARFTALVLAGTRPGGDPLALAVGISHKALIPIAGRSMLSRVLANLLRARSIERIVLCGASPAWMREVPDLAALDGAERISVIEANATPSRSVLGAMEQLRDRFPLLVTTADHPLLAPHIVDDFCTRALACDADVAVGLVPASVVRDAYPASRRTFIPLRASACCGSNLFAFLTAGARRAPEAWAEIEQHRKRPWRMVRVLGAATLLRFLLRRLTLADILALASRKMNVRVAAVLLPFADAAVDVDSLTDLALVDSILAARERAQASGA